MGWMIDALVWALFGFSGMGTREHGVMSLREKIFEHSRHAHWGGRVLPCLFTMGCLQL
jgi:hypothetical protein